MADRLEEIERRLAQRPKNGGLAIASWSDIAFLLAEVKRLQTAVHKLDAECHTHLTAAREAEDLALSLAEALEWYVENDDTNMLQEGNGFWIDGHNRGRAVLSDERLIKLREMKNE